MQADFIFSGWGAKLTEPELAVVEDRLPEVEAMEAEKEADGDYVELAGNDIPPHLRLDAPEAVCLRCKRHTWAAAEFGKECRMTQPDGFPCGGRFTNPT